MTVKIEAADYDMEIAGFEKRGWVNHPDPIIDQILKARHARSMVKAAELNLRNADEFGLHTAEQRQDAIDYITTQRLAAICHQQEADRLMEADYAEWLDWVDTQNDALAALRSF